MSIPPGVVVCCERFNMPLTVVLVSGKCKSFGKSSGNWGLSFVCYTPIMTEHLCQGSWIHGPVSQCEQHGLKKTKVRDVRPYDDRRTRLRIEGVAKTGQTSPQGTVEHLDYYSGRTAATAKPAPIRVKMMDLSWFRDRFVYREGKLIEKATGKEVAWTQESKHSKQISLSRDSKPTSSKPNSKATTPPSSAPSSRRPGVSIGRNGVSLQGSNPPLSKLPPSPKA